MLDKYLCTISKADKMEIFFVNYLDDLDDQIDVESNGAKKAALLRKKEIVLKLREDYSDLQKS